MCAQLLTLAVGNKSCCRAARKAIIFKDRKQQQQPKNEEPHEVRAFVVFYPVVAVAVGRG